MKVTAKQWKKTIDEMIDHNEKEIWINWINVPTSLLLKPNFVQEQRGKLFAAGYKRDIQRSRYSLCCSPKYRSS